MHTHIKPLSAAATNHSFASLDGAVRGRASRSLPIDKLENSTFANVLLILLPIIYTFVCCFIAYIRDRQDNHYATTTIMMMIIIARRR